MHPLCAPLLNFITRQHICCAQLPKVLVTVHLGMLAAIVITGLTQAHGSNMSPFLVGGLDNCFSSAAYLFFSYVG